MKLPLFILSVLAPLLIAAPVAAEQSKARIEILPLNCVFEIINDGSRNLRYLNPSVCRRYFDPPLPTTPELPVYVPPFLFNDFPLGGAQDTPIIPSTGNQILLNNWPEYEYLQRRLNLQLRTGMIVYFDVNPTELAERHSITIDQVTDRYVVLTIASTPMRVTLYLGQTEEYDVTNDGVNDIEIHLDSIAEGVANLGFRQLSAEPTETTSTIVRTTNHGWAVIAFFTIVGLLAITLRSRLAKSYIRARLK